MSALVEQLRTRLSSASPAGLLVGDDYRFEPGAAARPAAVLIAITDQPEPGVILTVRREHLRTHPGQVAFPGGRLDPGESAIDAALREADEELGLAPSAVTVTGTLAPYRTITDYDVTPVVGVIPPAPELSPHDFEVADWFEAPLAFLLDPANHARRAALFAGRERHYYAIEWDGRKIWGATAAMIVNLAARLR